MNEAEQVVASLLRRAKAEEEPRERVLYLFDHTDFNGEQTGSSIGWWSGRHWVACFGDGMWSPQHVTAWCPLKERVDALNGLVALAADSGVGGVQSK